MPGQEQSRHKRAPGERAGLSRTVVLDAALRIADQDGLGKLTMRRLAETLGVEAMTLYHYVPSKDALLDGMVERVFTQAVASARLGSVKEAGRAGDTGLPEDTEPAGDTWATALRQYAGGLREVLLAHPGVLPVAAGRTAATVETFQVVEELLDLLTSAGFGLAHALHAVNALTVFVIGHTSAEVSDRDGPPSGASSADIARLDAREFPLLVEAARTGQGTDDAQRFTFGVDAFATGLAAVAIRDTAPDGIPRA